MNCAVLVTNRLFLRFYDGSPIDDNLSSEFRLNHITYSRLEICCFSDEGHFTFDLETDRFFDLDGKVYEISSFQKHGYCFVFTLDNIDLFNQKELNPKDKELYEEDK